MEAIGETVVIRSYVGKGSFTPRVYSDSAMNSITSSHSGLRSVASGSPWGAVAPRAQFQDQEFKLVPDSFQFSPAKAEAASSRSPQAPAQLERVASFSALQAAQGASPSPLMVLLLGSHESSKKDQAATIAKNLGLVHLNMGELIRQEIATGSDLGSNLKKALDSGNESPALLLYDLVARRVAQPDVKEQGFVLDAYPEDLKHHKAEALLEELEGLRLVQLSGVNEACPNCIPVIEVAREKGAYFQVDDEEDEQDTADVLEALVDNFQSTPVRLLAVD